jgi:hypothetical protein
MHFLAMHFLDALFDLRVQQFPRQEAESKVEVVVVEFSRVITQPPSVT